MIGSGDCGNANENPDHLTVIVRKFSSWGFDNMIRDLWKLS